MGSLGKNTSQPSGSQWRRDRAALGGDEGTATGLQKHIACQSWQWGSHIILA